MSAVLRTTIAGLLAVLALPAIGVAAGAYRFPRFQPVSLAFIDARHGVLAEDDWVCQKAHGCESRILATQDGGSRWRATFTGARGIELFPVRGTPVVYALTGNAMIESTDAGLHWERLGWGQAVVSFVTPAHGWRLGRVTTLAHPPPLYETRDGGRSWSTRVDPCKGDYGVPAAMSFASKTRGWIICNTQATAGYQGKAVWMTIDGGTRWELRGRTHPIGPPEPKQQVGNLPGYGYPTEAAFLADGHGWVLQGRGDMLVTDDGGHTWQRSPLTKPDAIAAQSADLLSDRLGFVLLRGCTVRLVRTNLTTATATTLERWNSPTQCPLEPTLPAAGSVLGTIPIPVRETSLFTARGSALFLITFPEQHATSITAERIDPTGTHRRRLPFPLAYYLMDLSAGPKGLYAGTAVVKRFTNVPDELLRLDPATLTVRARASFPGRVAAVEAGDLMWASIGDGRVVRLDPTTLRVLASRRLVSARSVARQGLGLSKPAFGRGSLWAIAGGGTHAELVRMDPTTLAVRSRTRLASGAPLSEVIADRTHAYLARRGIASVDAQGRLVHLTTDSNLDAAAIFKDGLVGLNDAASALELLNAEGRVTARTPLHDLSGELAVSGDSAWFLGDAGSGNGIVHIRLAGS